jgi:hypothetical protein
MAHVTLQLDLDGVTADPGSPPDGSVWYRSDLDQYRGRFGGVTISFVDVNSMNDAITQAIQGLVWQEPVISSIATPPGGPTTGDRYRIIATATGAWTGHEDKIAEWNGTSWDLFTPVEGWVVRDLTADSYFLYDGAAWGAFTLSGAHSDLTGLGADDHTQYLLVNGTRAMSGALDMGGFAITNVGNVDGVDVSAHASRHVSGGADEIDGDILDIDYVPTNYTQDTTPPQVTTTAQLTAHLAGLDNAIAGVSADDEKAGTVLVGGFTGTPKQATVTFSTAYADANYAVVLTPRIQNNKHYTASIVSKTASAFTIQIDANNVPDLLAVDWNTKPYIDP